jgi:hypothetical protein
MWQKMSISTSPNAVNPPVHAESVSLDTQSWRQDLFPKIASGLAYFFTFMFVYYVYISPTWGYTGLYYRPLSLLEWMFDILLVTVVSALLPSRIDKASTLVIWLLYAFVFIPTVSITFMIGINSSGFYITALLALGVAIAACSIMSSNSPMPARLTIEPSPLLVYFLVFGNIGIFIILLYAFNGILSFSGIEDVYAQRSAASEAAGGIIDYGRTYFTYVFCPGVIALGLSNRKYRWMIFLGLAGYVLSYMIEASKIALVTPIIMLAFAIMQRIRAIRTSLFTGMLALGSGIASLFTDYSSLVRFFVDVLLLRSIAIPGQTFSQYYDLFSAKGYTYWSNTKIINLVVPPPAAFRADPAWPVLGRIVGMEFYGNSTDLNANANLFAGEGLAAAGPIGVVAIGLVLAYWLRLIDRYSREWSPAFTMAIMVPIGLGLTNAHLTTFLLSFGGLFWLIAFRFGLDRRRPIRSVSPQI